MYRGTASKRHFYMQFYTSAFLINKLYNQKLATVEQQQSLDFCFRTCDDGLEAMAMFEVVKLSLL